MARFFYSGHQTAIRYMSKQPDRADPAARSSHSPTDCFSAGQDVYLTQGYYDDVHASVLDIPRYGWQVKSIDNGVAKIEYQRRNQKLSMSLTVETKYLIKEV